MGREWIDPRPRGVVDRPAAVEELSDRMETLRRETARKVMRRFMADTTEMARERDRYRAALEKIVSALTDIYAAPMARMHTAHYTAIRALEGQSDG